MSVTLVGVDSFIKKKVSTCHLYIASLHAHRSWCASHHSEHLTILTNINPLFIACDVIGFHPHVGCCEGNEPHQNIDYTSLTNLPAEAGWFLSSIKLSIICFSCIGMLQTTMGWCASHHSEHPTLQPVFIACDVFGFCTHVGCCEGNEPHQFIDSTSHTNLPAEAGWFLS